MKRSPPALDKLFATQIQVLATTLRPKSVKCYRYCAYNFLRYLHTNFPRVHKLSQLRRDPHLLSWFRFLCQQYPPPRKRFRELHLLTIRRLLRDLADQEHPLMPDLIRREDFPPRDHYLPRPLPLEEDQHLQQQLYLSDTLEANALRLMRATGIRISECIALPWNCLQHLSNQQVALHVPLGKLHSEHLVPVDEETQRIVRRMVELGALTPISTYQSQAFLLPRYRQPETWYKALHDTLAEMARAAGCTSHVHPHRLRHAFATEMVRLGVSLPALMQMLGHKDIRMTLRYVEWFSSTSNANFTALAKTRLLSTPFPSSHFPPVQFPGRLTSLPFARVSALPTTSFSYSSLSWKIRLAVNFADSRSGSSPSTTNSIT